MNAEAIRRGDRGGGGGETRRRDAEWKRISPRGQGAAAVRISAGFSICELNFNIENHANKKKNSIIAKYLDNLPNLKALWD